MNFGPITMTLLSATLGLFVGVAMPARAASVEACEVSAQRCKGTDRDCEDARRTPEAGMVLQPRSGEVRSRGCRS